MTNLQKLQLLIHERNEIESQIQSMLVLVAKDEKDEEYKQYNQKHPTPKRNDIIRITAYHGSYSAPLKACVGAELRVTSTFYNEHYNLFFVRCVTQDGRPCLVKPTLHDWEIIQSKKQTDYETTHRI